MNESAGDKATQSCKHIDIPTNRKTETARHIHRYTITHALSCIATHVSIFEQSHAGRGIQSDTQRVSKKAIDS